MAVRLVPALGGGRAALGEGATHGVALGLDDARDGGGDGFRSAQGEDVSGEQRAEDDGRSGR